jgi:hypothetical protein
LPIAVPSYLLQLAIALVSVLMIGVVAALGPFLAFALQAIEGLIAYSTWSLVGLAQRVVGNRSGRSSDCSGRVRRVLQPMAAASVN